VSDVTGDNDRPILDAEGFQRLLAAAFILQSQNISSRVETRFAGYSLDNSTAPVVRTELALVVPVAPLQKRTPSLRQPSGLSARFRLALQQPSKPMLWRASEAFAVAIVFCLMIVLSIRRVSPFGSDPSLRSVLAGRRSTGGETQEVKLVSQQQPLATLRPSQHRNPGMTGRDFIVDYRRRPERSGQPAQVVKVPPQPGVRLTFGVGTDMIAADTVVRYRVQSAAATRQRP
jgi:hypothetical protein